MKDYPSTKSNNQSRRKMHKKQDQLKDTKSSTRWYIGESSKGNQDKEAIGKYKKTLEHTWRENKHKNKGIIIKENNNYSRNDKVKEGYNNNNKKNNQSGNNISNNGYYLSENQLVNEAKPSQATTHTLCNQKTRSSGICNENNVVSQNKLKEGQNKVNNKHEKADIKDLTGKTGKNGKAKAKAEEHKWSGKCTDDSEDQPTGNQIR
ncbi:unnamed protein product [Vicia faba]|uniref:Uncharacterized protein n=1 Tax=Vicia faba TaxID=3906 RepID=A0AAV0YZ01_VICFA|nr:unnamed protein product [Vicia faba]